MAWIHDRENNKFVSVRNLKNIKTQMLPDEMFFVHRSLKIQGYSLSHVGTGCNVAWGCKTMQEAIDSGMYRVMMMGKHTFYEAVERAKEKQIGAIYES